MPAAKARMPITIGGRVNPAMIVIRPYRIKKILSKIKPMLEIKCINSPVLMF